MSKEQEELAKRQMAKDLAGAGGGGGGGGGAAEGDADPGKIAVVTVGKFQGPHFGHRVLIQQVADTAEMVGGEPFVFTSTSKEIMSKPHFKIDEKLAIMGKMFGNIINPANIKEGYIRSVFALVKNGYKTIYILAGSDRLKTETDCVTEFGKDTKEFKKCWKDSFLKSVIPSLEKMGVDVKTIVAGEERGDETAEGAPSGKNFRSAASSLVKDYAIANKERAEATLTRLMNEGSSVQFTRSDIVKHAKSMVKNVDKPGKGGRRTRRRQKTRHRQRKRKTAKNVRKKKRTRRIRRTRRRKTRRHRRQRKRKTVKNRRKKGHRTRRKRK